MTDETPEHPSLSTLRIKVIGVSVLMAFILYLDRVCLGEIVKSESFLSDFEGASKEEIGEVMGAFFFAYALFQVPSGWASDRFGGRLMLTIYIIAWSVLTGISGFSNTLNGLLIARLAFGAVQSGAYSTSSSVIRRWFHFQSRATASSYVSIGGRLGGTLAPFLTTLLVMQLSSWRYVLHLYCLIGFAIAFAYWKVVRDRPADHPDYHAPDGEANQITEEPEERSAITDIFPLMLAIIRSRSLWLNAIAQFCFNFGWAFLITWLPTYLTEELNVEPVTGAVMVTLVLAIAIPGQVIGGRFGNYCVGRLGHRAGRIVPLCVTSCVAAVAYFGCTLFDSAWGIVACCACVSLMTDIGNPTVWAFMQDVGGKDSAAVFGWGNMWGNFGGAAVAMAVPHLMNLGESMDIGDGAVFMTCSGMYLLAAVVVLGTDATKTVRPRPPGELEAEEELS